MLSPHQYCRPFSVHCIEGYQANLLLVFLFPAKNYQENFIFVLRIPISYKGNLLTRFLLYLVLQSPVSGVEAPAEMPSLSNILHATENVQQKCREMSREFYFCASLNKNKTFEWTVPHRGSIDHTTKFTVTFSMKLKLRYVISK
jgi:hypothetical protein